MKSLLFVLLRKAKRRIILQIACYHLLESLMLFSLTSSLLLLAIRLLYPVTGIEWWLTGLAGAFLLFALLRTSLFHIPEKDVALQIDAHEDLKERISSLLCVPENAPLKAALEEDVLQFVQRLDYKHAFPWRRKRLLLLSLLSLAVYLGLFAFLPESDLFSWGKRAKEHRLALKENKEIAAQILKQVAKVQSEFPENKPDPNLKALLEDLKKLAEKLENKPSENRKEDIAELNRMMDRLEKLEENKANELAKNNPTLEEKFSSQDLEETKKLAEAIQKSNFKEAAAELTKMKQELKKLLEKKKLKKKLSKKEEEKLEKMQKELDKLAKAMKENSKLSKELKKALEEIAQFMEKMSKLDSLSAKEKEEMEQDLMSLEELEKQLKDLQNLAEQLKQMQDMYKKLKDSKKKLAKADTCPTCGDKKCPICEGSKCEHGDKKCEGHKPEDFLLQDGSGDGKKIPIPADGLGDKEGTGLTSKGKGKGGGKVEEAPTNDKNWKPFEIKGNKFEGKTIAEFQFQGEGPKGEAKAPYREYANKMAQDATGGLTEKKIPQPYHEYVKKYFDTVSNSKK